MDFANNLAEPRVFVPELPRFRGHASGLIEPPPEKSFFINVVVPAGKPDSVKRGLSYSQHQKQSDVRNGFSFHLFLQHRVLAGRFAESAVQAEHSLKFEANALLLRTRSALFSHVGAAWTTHADLSARVGGEMRHDSQSTTLAPRHRSGDRIWVRPHRA